MNISTIPIWATPVLAFASEFETDAKEATDTMDGPTLADGAATADPGQRLNFDDYAGGSDAADGETSDATDMTETAAHPIVSHQPPANNMIPNQHFFMLRTLWHA